MTVRDFIQEFLIKEIGELKKDYPFQSFTLMATGIEFLGKCLSNYEWDIKNKSKDEFELAIKHLESFEKYERIPQFYDKLRCGLAHLGIPKIGIKLDRGKNDLSKSNDIILGCEEFYEDFKNACIEILEDTKGITKNNMEKDYATIDDTITGSTKSNIEII